MTLVWLPVGTLCAAPAGVGAVLSARRDDPGSGALAVAAGALAALGVVAGVGRSAVVPTVVASRATLLCWGVATFAWALFVLEYTGRGPVVTRRRAVVLGGLVVLCLGAVQVTATEGFPTPVRQVAVVVANVTQLATIGTGAFGVFAVFRATAAYGDLRRPTGTTLAVGGATTTLVILAATFSQVLTTDATFQAMLVPVAVGGTAFAAAVGPLALFERSPRAAHLARERAFDDLPVAVLVVDRDGRVLEANDTARETFAPDDAPTGRPVRAVLGADPSGLGADRVSLSTAGGRREFAVVRSTLSGQGGDPVGEVYRLEDVTDRRTAEQRLSVLERVLRHNLRNDLDALEAFGRRLAEAEAGDGDGAGDRSATDDDLRRAARRVEDLATELVELGETAGRAERLLSGAPETDRVDLADLARTVARAVADDRPGTATVRAPADVVVRTDRALLRAALAELVTNGLEHADREAPTVTVVVRSAADGGQIAVHDEGPGIPERERAVLLAGDERPLRHGSGLGLWLVYWCVTTLGGRIEFDADDDGSVVTVGVPDRPAPHGEST